MVIVRAAASVSMPFDRSHATWERACRRTVEIWVLAENRVVQAAQLGTRLEPHLVEQDPPGVPERLQRLRLPAAAIEREHALTVQPLAQRVLADQVVELAEHRVVSPAGQRGVDRRLARLQPEVLEPPDLGCGERLVGKVVERRPAPQRECLTQVRAVLARRHEALEAQCVNGVGIHPQLIAATARDDLRVGARELLAQLGDEHLHELRRRSRRPFTPQPLDQPIGGHRGIRVQCQHREQRTRLRAAQRQRVPLPGGLDQTQ
jgi:hypothetical protein